MPRLIRAHVPALSILNFPKGEVRFSAWRTYTAGPAAFLSVQEGCDKFCAFCVVPYTRGAEFSRPVGTVVAEARRLVSTGTRELTLLGQNVNAFHGEAPDGKIWNLARLLAELAEIEGLERLRYTTSHPLDMDDDLINMHRDLPQLMPISICQSNRGQIMAAVCDEPPS